MRRATAARAAKCPRIGVLRSGRYMSGSSYFKIGIRAIKPTYGCAIIVCALIVVTWAQIASAAVIVGSMQEPFADYTAGTTFNNITPPSTSQNGGQGWNTTGTTDPNDTGASWGTTNNGGANRTITLPGLTYSATNYLAPSGNKLTLDA